MYLAIFSATEIMNWFWSFFFFIPIVKYQYSSLNYGVKQFKNVNIIFSIALKMLDMLINIFRTESSTIINFVKTNLPKLNYQILVFWLAYNISKIILLLTYQNVQIWKISFAKINLEMILHPIWLKNDWFTEISL